jgi:ATP-dependent helicase/DNAse subunit B
MLVLTGPSGSGKTHRILAEFREAVKERRSDIRLVVPTATLVQHLRHELAREGLVFSPRTILTLSAFISEICGELAAPDNATLALAAEAAVREVNAPEFARVSRMPGFHAALVHTIGELDAAGCTPEQFGRIPLDAPLARPLLAVWRSIERQLASRKLFTRSQILRRAPAEIAKCTRLPGRIWFDGFAGFPRPELELIEALTSKSDVTVALPSLATAIPALADLRAAGFDFEELTGPRDPEESTPFEAAWFQAENVEREADEIARRILLYHESGRDFRDIAVVLRTPEEITPLLETTFERFGIPARFYFSGALAEHPEAKFAMHLVEALLSGWDLEATLAALRLLPGLAPSTALDRWDIAIREHLPGAGLEVLRKLGVHPIERFAGLDSWRGVRWSAQRWADVLAEIPDRFAPPRPKDGASWNQTVLERSQAAAVKAWAGALEVAAGWLGTEPFITLEEFWQTASVAIRLTPLNVPDARRSVVHVMSVFEARQWDPAVMFIPNLTEKIFPRYHSQDPFLPDSAVRQLKDAGIRLRDSRDRDAEESCLFDAVAQRPLGQGRKRREICLSYPRRNARGDENLRSSFFARLRATESKPLPARPALANPPIPLHAVTPVRSADLLGVLAQRHANFSPSSLEVYARCPFQFFAGRTLRLKSLPDTPEERLSYLVQGNIVHEVLKQWTAMRGDVKPLFDAVFDAACEKEHIQRTYRTEVLRRQMLADLGNFCASFETYGVGASLTEQPFEFALFPDVQLRGRIDRIDTTEDDGAIIVDYKYSNNTKQNVNDETKLQGVLYTIAAVRHLKLTPQATVFVGVKKDHRPFGWGNLPGHALQPLTSEWLDKGLETVARVTREIREGSVEPHPSDLKHCEYCEFRDACRYEGAEAVRGA